MCIENIAVLFQLNAKLVTTVANLLLPSAQNRAATGLSGCHKKYDSLMNYQFDNIYLYLSNGLPRTHNGIHCRFIFD